MAPDANRDDDRAPVTGEGPAEEAEFSGIRLQGRPGGRLSGTLAAPLASAFCKREDSTARQCSSAVTGLKKLFTVAHQQRVKIALIR